MTKHTSVLKLAFPVYPLEIPKTKNPQMTATKQQQKNLYNKERQLVFPMPSLLPLFYGNKLKNDFQFQTTPEYHILLPRVVSCLPLKGTQ